MNKVRWEITSRNDFGPIRLGMTKEEANNILGMDVRYGGHPLYPGIHQDSYNKKQVVLIYSECLRVSYIEVAYPFKVMYLGMDIMRMPLLGIKTLFENNELRVEKIKHRELCVSEGICLNGSDTKNHMDSVCLFADDYWEKTEALWQEYKKELARQTEEMRQKYGVQAK